MATKIDDYGVGPFFFGWLKVKRASELLRQQCKGYLVRDGRSMILLVLLRAHGTGRCLENSPSTFFGRHAIIKIYAGPQKGCYRVNCC